jgi:hypothetical protein
MQHARTSKMDEKMTRTKGKYSPWQSGTIAPKLSGYYHRRLTQSKAPLDDGYFYLQSGVWSVGSTLAFAYSDLQQSNGHEWQWRGIIDEE